MTAGPTWARVKRGGRPPATGLGQTPAGDSSLGAKISRGYAGVRFAAPGRAADRARDSSWEPRSVAVRGSAVCSTRAGGGLGPRVKFGCRDQCGYARSGRGGGQSESREGALGGEKCAMISHVAPGCGELYSGVVAGRARKCRSMKRRKGASQGLVAVGVSPSRGRKHSEEKSAP